MHALAGIRIVVTRAAEQAKELVSSLRDLGAEVISLPAIEIGPPSDPGPLRRAIEHLNDYDWIIFSSANAVNAFAAIGGGGKNCRARIAAVGPHTREVAEQRGFTISLSPERYLSESLVEAFGKENVNGKRILIPSAALTREVVESELRKRGALVEVVEAYRNLAPANLREHGLAILREPYPDWITFASSSAVDHVIAAIGPEPFTYTKIATIGPITSETVRKHGLTVAAEALMHDVPGLIEAILASASHRPI